MNVPSPTVSPPTQPHAPIQETTTYIADTGRQEPQKHPLESPPGRHRRATWASLIFGTLMISVFYVNKFEPSSPPKSRESLVVYSAPYQWIGFHKMAPSRQGAPVVSVDRV